MYLEKSTNPILKSFAKVYEMRKAGFRFFHHGQQEKEKIVIDFLTKIIKQSDFSICVPVECFAAIVESDFIKNSMQTGQGSTMGGNEVRKQALATIYGVEVEGVAAEDFPKYGILTGQNKVADLINDPDVFYHYGAVMLTLKKENFINRTTLTVGSSLDFLEPCLKTPIPLDDITPVCIKGMPTKPVKPGTQVFNGFEFFYDLIVNNKINTEHPNRLSMATDNFIGFENYELQFFGPIQFSKDVKSICVFPIGENDYDVVSQYKSTLDQYGISLSNLFDELNFS